MLKGSWRCHKSDLSAHVLPKAIFNKELRKQCNFFCTLLISYWFETMYFQILLKELDTSKVTKWQSGPDNIYRIWESFEAFCSIILKLILSGLLKWLHFYHSSFKTFICEYTRSNFSHLSFLLHFAIFIAPELSDSSLSLISFLHCQVLIILHTYLLIF